MTDFYCLNPGTDDYFRFRPSSFTLSLPKQIDSLDSRSLDLTTPREVPIKQSATILVKEQENVIFRGYVESYSMQRNSYENYRSCAVMGFENLLNQRWAALYDYPAGTCTYAELFSDTCTNGKIPGLLAIANSMLAPGWAYTLHDSASHTYKIANGGTNYRLNGKAPFAIDYRYLVDLDLAASLADCISVDNTYYQSATDLYVHIDNHYHRGWADIGGLLLSNAFDTTIRLGDVPAENVDGELQTAYDKIGDLIVNIANGDSKFVHWRDTEEYTYLDIDTAEGRTTGYILEEHELESLERTTPGDPLVRAIFGRGEGNQMHTTGDLTYDGIWTQDVYEVDQAYKDAYGNLKTRVTAKYNERQTDYCWRVAFRQRADRTLLLKPGDFVTLRPYHEADELLSITNIDLDEQDVITLDLGQKRPTFNTSWEILLGEAGAYTKKYLRESHKSITQTTTFNAGSTGTMTFAVPDGVKTASLRPVITIKPTLSLTSDTADIGRCAVVITVDGVKPNFGQLVATTIGESGGEGLPEIDVTSQITEDADNDIVIGVYATPTSTKEIDASVIMKFYKRTEKQ